MQSEKEPEAAAKGISQCRVIGWVVRLTEYQWVRVGWVRVGLDMKLD